ncbi:MAG: TetR/AcrR family transcriptional regulator [Deltaproteobacteria bacterium]|nr:TetR/AcrR family transcriptional regulator [Deltaproteobacteria bacterium]
MGRKRIFDEDLALDAAVSCFWQQGYSGTSVRHLCDAMGIGSGSFYAAFLDKETCFRLALTRYLQSQGTPHTPSPAAVEGWFFFITRKGRAHRGCMLVGSAGQWEQLDPGNQEFVRVQLQRMEDFFWLCLKPRFRAREDAALLAAGVLGIHVLSFAGFSHDSLVRSAKSCLHSVGLQLRNPREGSQGTGTIDT